MYGTYTDECVRTPDGWRISGVTLPLVRQEGNREVMRLAKRGSTTSSVYVRMLVARATNIRT